MICLAIGAGILAAIAFRKARYYRHGYYYGGCGHHSWYGWHHYGRRRWPLDLALSHLDATPAQERAIVAEIERLRERVSAVKGQMKDARGDLAAAIRGPVLDDAALGAVLGRVDGATAEARGAVIDALRNIHGLLDDKQRERLAALLDRSGWHGVAGGPYRV
jgi:Spy/CpxP family protein refolding chaperone